MSICCLCDKDVEDNEEWIECDSCDSLFHLKCAHVTKTEAKARKNSKCLKLYCPDCFKSKSEGTPEKLKEILKLLYKIDMNVQQQKTTTPTVPSSIEHKLNSLEEKIIANCVPKNNNNTTESTVRPVNTKNVKSGSVKPAVVIKPKAKQSSSKTFNEITEKIGKRDLNVCGTRNARDGGVVLRCENAAETLKAKQIVDEKLGSSYDVILPKVKSPRVRISNIAPDIPLDSIVDELKKNNDEIKDMNMRLITVISRKFRSVDSNEAVVELSSESFNKLMANPVLKLPWRECRVFEHLHVERCFKCCGFFNKSTNCKQTQKCSRCDGQHKFSECKAKKMCCTNCKQANAKFKMNLDTNHHAFNNQCPIFQRRLVSVKNKIEYNEAE